jgi:hypothetical protein
MWEKDKQNRPLENKYNHIFNKQVALGAKHFENHN